VSGLRRSSASAAGRSRAAALLGGQIPAVFSRLATCGAGACAPSMQRFRRRDTSGRQCERVVPLRKGNLVWGVTRGPGACATESKIGSCIEPIQQVKIQHGIKRKCDETSRERTPQPGGRPRGGSSTVRNHYAVTRSPAGAQSLRCHTIGGADARSIHHHFALIQTVHTAVLFGESCSGRSSFLVPPRPCLRLARRVAVRGWTRP